MPALEFTAALVMLMSKYGYGAVDVAQIANVSHHEVSTWLTSRRAPDNASMVLDALDNYDPPRNLARGLY